MDEQWRDIEGYEDYYQVSTLGRVRALERVIIDITGIPRRRSKRVLRSHSDADGYYNVRLCREGKARNLRVHRLVAQAFIHNPQGKPVVMHLDNDPANNEVGNLRWGTVLDNNRYAIDGGRRAGIHPNSKITELKAKAIKYLLNSDLTQQEIALATGSTRGIVKAIACGDTWKDI